MKGTIDVKCIHAINLKDKTVLAYITFKDKTLRFDH